MSSNSKFANGGNAYTLKALREPKVTALSTQSTPYVPTPVAVVVPEQVHPMKKFLHEMFVAFSPIAIIMVLQVVLMLWAHVWHHPVINNAESPFSTQISLEWAIFIAAFLMAGTWIFLGYIAISVFITNKGELTKRQFIAIISVILVSLTLITTVPVPFDQHTLSFKEWGTQRYGVTVDPVHLENGELVRVKDSFQIVTVHKDANGLTLYDENNQRELKIIK